MAAQKRTQPGVTTDAPKSSEPIDTALWDLGLRDSTDRGVFIAARRAGAFVMTKDEDFPAGDEVVHYVATRWDLKILARF